MENPYTTTIEYEVMLSRNTKAAMAYFCQRYDSDKCRIQNTAHLDLAYAKVQALIKEDMYEEDRPQEFIDEHIRPVYLDHYNYLNQIIES